MTGRTDISEDNLQILMDMYASGMTSTKKSCKKAIEEASKKTSLNETVIKTWIGNHNRKHDRPNATKSTSCVYRRKKSIYNLFCSQTAPDKKLSMKERNLFWREEFSKLSMKDKEALRKQLTDDVSIMTLEKKRKLIKRNISDLEKICNNLSRLGVDCLALYIMGNNLNGCGSEKGLSFIKEKEALQANFLQHCGSASKVEDIAVKALKDRVQKLFNRKYSEATGLDQRVPYRDIMSKKTMVEVEGLPTGMVFKKPSSLGRESLKRILEAADSIKFSVKNNDLEREALRKRTNENSILHILEEELPTDIQETETDMEVAVEEEIEDLASTTHVIQPEGLNGNHDKDNQETEMEVPVEGEIEDLASTSHVSQSEGLKGKHDKAGKKRNHSKKSKRDFSKKKNEEHVQSMSAREILDSLSNGGSSLYEDPNIYEIEKLMSMKKIKGSNHYLVKWKHYGASDNTWEPEENIPQTVLTDFWLKKVKTSKQ